MTDFSQSAAYNSYIGSVLSLISKSEIRYQGVLSHVDTVHASIGLQNVRSFGTEGRRKDGPQVLPSDKVYDYIYFRGTDVKDLQVISSPPQQSAPAMPDDPAIISTNYIPPAPASASMLPAGIGPATNFSANIQLGLPESTFRPVGSWFPSSPQIPNDNGRASSPLYWQGYNGPSNVQPTSAFVGSPSQQIPYSVTNNGSSSPSSFFPFPSSLLPSFSNSSLDNRTTVFFPPNPSSLNVSVGGSTLLAPSRVHNHLENIQPTFIPSSKFTPLTSSSSPFLKDTNPAVPPLACSPNSVFASASPSKGIFTYMPSIDKTSVKSPASASNHAASASPSQGIFTYMPSNDETSVTSPASASNHAASVSPSQGIFTYMPSIDETPVTNPASASNHAQSAMPSLVKAEHLLQSMPSSFPSSLSLETDQKDIEVVVQASKSESLPVDAKEEHVQAPFSVPAAEKLKAAFVHPHYHDKSHEGGEKLQQQKQGGERKQQQQERGVTGGKKGFHGADSRAKQGIRTWHVSKDKFPGADTQGNQGTRSWHASKDKFHGYDSRDNQGVKTWHASKDKLNGAAAHYHHSNRAHGQGQGKEFYGGAKLSHLSYKSHVKVNGSSQPRYHGIKSHERQNWVSEASSSPNTKGLARGKQNWVSQPVMKFTEDFDFEAMNEKFNKDEVWGQLGKHCKTKSDKKEDPIGSNEDGQCQEDKFALPKTETKIYIKDDFFDSLSHGDILNRELKEGRIKLSDRKKMDKETFGDDVLLNRGAHSGMQRGPSGQSGGHGHTRVVETFDGPQLNRGSRSGRGRGGRSSGIGRTGRVEGRAVWCRVT